jgi:rod shape-determining protein MreD
MRHFILALLTYFALATQVACGNQFVIGECRLPVMWLPVLLAVTWFADARGIAWAAMIGLLADGLSSGRFGQEMLATTLAAALMLPLLPEPRSRSVLVMLVWQFALIGSGLLVSHGYASLFDGNGPLLLSALPQIALEAAFGVIVFSTASKMIEAISKPVAQAARL